jgi:hypothetical protein
VVKVLCYKSEGRWFDYHQWPPKRNRAVLWFLTTYVTYRLQKGHIQTLEEYHDFLRRSRWKMEQKGTLDKYVGNYLCVLDWPRCWPKAS